MKIFRNTQKILLAAFFFNGFSSVAWAATVNNTADIDMTTIKITQVSGNAALVLSPSYSSVETTINDQSDFSEDIQGGPVSLFSDNGEFVSATADIDQFDVLGQTSVEPNGYANAIAQHELKYTASGSGDVRVSVDYNLFADFIDLNNESISSYGLVELLDEGSNKSSDASIFNEGFASDPTEIRGTLDLTLSLIDGDMGFLQFTATSNSDVSAVPVPPSFLLFSSSLIGLLIKRKLVA